jgi:hypothetical protein
MVRLVNLHWLSQFDHLTSEWALWKWTTLRSALRLSAEWYLVWQLIFARMLDHLEFVQVKECSEQDSFWMNWNGRLCRSLFICWIRVSRSKTSLFKCSISVDSCSFDSWNSCNSHISWHVCSGFNSLSTVFSMRLVTNSWTCDYLSIKQYHLLWIISPILCPSEAGVIDVDCSSEWLIISAINGLADSDLCGSYGNLSDDEGRW